VHHSSGLIRSNLDGTSYHGTGLEKSTIPDQLLSIQSVGYKLMVEEHLGKDMSGHYRGNLSVEFDSSLRG
jgi:hypothetical protein